MNRRTIYFIYLLILLSAVFYRTVKADSVVWTDAKKTTLINNLTLQKLEAGTDVVISLSEMVRPQTFFFAKENSVVLDFLNVFTDKDLAEAFSNDDLKLGYVINGGDKTRIKLFVKPENKMKLVYAENDVIVKLRHNSMQSQLEGKKKQNRGLLEPADKKYSQAVLSFTDSDFDVVVKKLADEADIELQLGENLPQKISAHFETSTPFEALRNIACENNLKFYNSGKSWHLSGV